MNYKVVSVVIPCYNSEEFIEEAITSILKQNFNDYIEVIVVDDGSTDGTNELCLRYADSGQIKYFRIENHGAGYARNFGVNKASGKWVVFLDADDLLLLDTDHFVMNSLLQNETMDILCFGKVQSNMELTSEPYIKFPQQVDKIKNNIPVLEFWTCIYKTDFLRKKNVLFFEYREQDIETAFRYRAFSSTEAIKSFDIPLIVQRNNLNSNTHTWNEYVLFSIKAKVYYQLFSETSVVKDKKYLLNVTIENLLAYYKLLLMKGYQDDKTFQDIRDVLKKVQKENTFFNIKYGLSVLIDSLIYRKILIPKPYTNTKASNSLERVKYCGEINKTIIKLEELSEKVLKSSDFCIAPTIVDK